MSPATEATVEFLLLMAVVWAFAVAVVAVIRHHMRLRDDGKKGPCPRYEGECPRVRIGMECPECEYPMSEAMVPLDPDVPHRPHRVEL